ncbi:Aminoglycoside phosphotransferase [Penicillium brevicompactum]|uniref:Aminoglycoside phosphotransferase n=1 Tax=Penicillium brevicompactum TaxID=5074 RepID=A0A9W9RN20_PENBR|nr:Aminoglycoside phosphotransferase [Penicillium brevicompactum]
MTVMNLISCPAGGDAYSIPPPPITITQLPHNEKCHSIAEIYQPIDVDHDPVTPKQHTDIDSETSTPTDSSIMESDTETPHQPTDTEANIPTTALVVDEDSPVSSTLQPSEISDQTPATTPPGNVESNAATQKQGHKPHNETSNTTDSDISQEGLEWSPTGFCGGLVPKWTREPDMEAIKQTVQYLYPASTVEIEFLGQGAFNKVYTATVDGKEFVMKVALPVDPWYKTESEVATMRFVRKTTNLPVPEVFAYQSSRDNPICFEWIFMEKMPGKPCREVWRDLPWEAKERMVRQLAQAQAALFQHKFEGIGSLYEPSWSCDTIPTPGPPSPQDPTKDNNTLNSLQYSTDGATDWLSNGPLKRSLSGVDRIVSIPFFWGPHLQQQIPRGPFDSSQHWITARLAIIRNEFEPVVKRLSAGKLSRDEECDKIDGENTLKRMEKLGTLLPRMQQMQDDSRPSVIFHDDLSRNNILVGDGGEMTGVIDWEFVSLVPSWRVCDYPEFLRLTSSPRLSKPDPATYSPEADGSLSEMYFEDLDQYETTVLRKSFMEEMNRVAKPWVDLFDQAQTLKDFDLAVTHCDDVLGLSAIESWITDLGDGKANLESLQERWWASYM